MFTCNISLCSMFSIIFFFSLYSLNRVCRVSQWGTQPIRPELGESGITEYRWMLHKIIIPCLKQSAYIHKWRYVITYNIIILKQIYTTYRRCLLKVSGSLANKVLTNPNNCITLSSCLKSSCPFSRNINSDPLLPTLILIICY